MSSTTRTPAILFSAILVLAGVVFVLIVLLAIPGTIGVLISNIGLAFIVAGVTGIFNERVLLRRETEDTAKAVVEVLHQSQEDTTDLIATKIHAKLVENPPVPTGIRQIASTRRHLDRYYQWAISKKPQTLFFAGRSVLHRIDQDFQMHNLDSAEGVLASRLADGARIRILFLDPRIDIIERLAREEGQQLDKMLRDIAISIGICQRLYKLLEQTDIHKDAKLEIGLYDAVPYFAYHRVDQEVIIGFYFSVTVGDTSAAFEILDTDTRDTFESHFNRIFERSVVLLQASGTNETVMFNDNLFHELKTALVNSTLGLERTERLFAGTAFA